MQPFTFGRKQEGVKNMMSPESFVEHQKEMPRLKPICENCEHSGMGCEPQGVCDELICKLSPVPQDVLRDDDLTPEERSEYYGSDTPEVYYGLGDLEKCPIRKW